jgi:IMP dehydrogenase
MEEEADSKVSDYMSKYVVTVAPDQTLEEVARLMRKSRHDGFPVVKNGNIVGIVTSRDLILRRKGKKVRDVMTKKVIVTYPNTHVTDAARVMFREGLSKLPVINEERKLVGIFTNMDVIRSHIERVTPDKVRKVRETLESLYSVRTVVRLTKVKISELIPTQNKVQPEEFRGREYEMKRGLAEPIVVVRTGDRNILVDGHHRVLAAMELGMDEIDAFVIALSKNIELGLERTAKSMGLRSIKDIKISKEADRGIVEVIDSTKA